MYVKKSSLKRLIKEILKEWRPGGTTGEWVEPNGTSHDVKEDSEGDKKDHHWFWADDYLKTHGPNRFKDDPIDELIARGWMRLVYSYNDSLIMVMVGNRGNKYLTRQQREYLEDQSEQTRWSVVDDGGYELYRSIDCITKENPLGEVTQKDLKSTMPGVSSWNIKKVPNQPTQQTPNFKLMTLDNLKALKDKAGRTLKYLKKNKPEEYSQYRPLFWKQWQTYDFEIKRRLKQINQKIPESTEPSIGGSYSDQATNVAGSDITQMERDPLNDPELNGKMNESYRFEDFHWLANMSGFGKPTNVYHDSILLGVIISEPNGYVIDRILGPKGTVSVKKTSKNKFKTKNDAAETLHRTWKSLRNITTKENI